MHKLSIYVSPKYSYEETILVFWQKKEVGHLSIWEEESIRDFFHLNDIIERACLFFSLSHSDIENAEKLKIILHPSNLKNIFWELLELITSNLLLELNKKNLWTKIFGLKLIILFWFIFLAIAAFQMEG